MITKRQYGSTRSPVPKVHVSAQILTPYVTPSSLSPSEGLCFHVCKMGTIIPIRAAVRMLEITAVNGGIVGWCWGCGCPQGLCLPICFAFSSSPFMNKFFPANFPNRQYQLLFTQGSGENKEGQCWPLSPAWGVFLLLSPLSVCFWSSLVEQIMEKVGSGVTCLGSHPSSATAYTRDSGRAPFSL